MTRELQEKLDLYESLLEAIGELGQGVACLDLTQQRLIYVNDAFSFMCGYSREELLEMSSFFQLVAPREIESLTQLMVERLDGEQTPNFYEVTLLHRSGREINIEAGIHPTGDSAGSLIAVVRETTARHHLERRISEDAIIEAARSVYDGLDLQSGLEKLMEKLAALFPVARLSIVGFEGEEHLRVLASAGRHVPAFDDHQPPMSKSPFEEALRSTELLVVPDTAAGRFNLDRERAEAGVRSYAVLPLIENGRTFGGMFVGLDEPGGPDDDALRTLERVAAALTGTVFLALTFERQLKTIAQLEELDRLKNEFLSFVSHDLRGPIAAISGFAKTLTALWDEIEDGIKRDWVERLNRSADRLVRFVNDVLSMSLLETGEFKWERRPFDIVQLGNNVVEEMSQQAASHHIALQPDPHIPLVLGDEQRQWQVLVNLVSNAAKFSPEGSKVGIEIVREGDYVRVSVSDRGVGIGVEDLPKLFTKLVRLESSQPGAPRGTGLGLYLCKLIVEAQGGRIWVESIVGQGTTVHYTVPVADR